MTLSRDTFCSFCGTKYDSASSYPRTCTSCKTMVWANPLPVSVVLVPVVKEGRTGLLVIRRAIPPGVGKLALVGGFLEDHETWQVGGAREVREETGVTVDAATLRAFWFTSTEPKPNRVLLFSIATPMDVMALGAYTPDKETSERGIVFGSDGLDEIFAFNLHADAVRRYFEEQGVTGKHDFVAA